MDVSDARCGARLRAVRARIADACARAGRETGDVRLLAVSKQHPPEALRALHALGQREFGENRLQEAAAKQDALADLDLRWHFIGPVQSNKTREIAARFDWVQSVDREKLLRRLGEQRPAQLPPLSICLQVNIDAEPQKSGARPEELAGLAAMTRDYPRLRLRGLMCLPEYTDDERATLDSFRRVAELQETLRRRGFELDTLSMGMSGDLELAIQAGSTMVRIGTDLFGPRPDPGAQPP